MIFMKNGFENMTCMENQVVEIRWNSITFDSLFNIAF